MGYFVLQVSATYLDGFKATGVAVIGGGRAAVKSRKTAEAILKRSRALLKKKGRFQKFPRLLGDFHLFTELEKVRKYSMLCV